MKMRIAKLLLVLIGSAALVAGCETSNNSAAGGMGNQTETGSGDTGPNNSVGPGNPFGLGTSSGITKAH